MCNILKQKLMIISFANNKGGVGKTTTTFNVGHGLANSKKKVLMIDMDPQTNLSTALGVFYKPKLSIYNLLLDECKIDEAIIKKSDKLHFIASTIDLSVMEFDNTQTVVNSLKEILEPVKSKYDYILIDTPPGFGTLSINSIQAADKVFIPVIPDFFSYQGLTQFSNVVHSINPNAEIGGIIITHYDKRKVLVRDFADGIAEQFGDKLMKTYIRENITISEAIAKGQDVFTYNSRSNGALDYSQLTKDILKIK